MLIEEQIGRRGDVVLGQYLARPEFAVALEALAVRCGAEFREVMLETEADVLRERLAARARHPDRPEHTVNSALVGPEDAEALIASLEQMRRRRPGALVVDADGTVEQTLAALLDALRAT